MGEESIDFDFVYDSFNQAHDQINPLLFKTESMEGFFEETPFNPFISFAHIELEGHMFFASSSFAKNVVESLLCYHDVVLDHFYTYKGALIEGDELIKPTLEPCDYDSRDYLIGEVATAYRPVMSDGLRVWDFWD